MLLTFFAETTDCQMHVFYKEPAKGYNLLAQYPEDISFCQEMCIQSLECEAVALDEATGGNSCLVLAASFPCEVADVWVNEPFELNIP